MAEAQDEEEGQGRYLEKLVRLKVRTKGKECMRDARIQKKCAKFVFV